MSTNTKAGTRDNPHNLTSVEGLNRWSKGALAGEWARYWCGDLAGARFMSQDIRAVNMGGLAWKLQLTGRFVLTQQRTSMPHVFNYLIKCVKTERQATHGQERNREGNREGGPVDAGSCSQ